MRSDAREAAFKIVFAQLFHDGCDHAFKSSVIRKGGLIGEDAEFALRLVALVEEHKEELLTLLSEKIERFADYRIYSADKAILLIALAEILYCDDVPPVVSASEAVGLARKFSTENSMNFVNGVLAGVINP